ncbi:MAG: STAS domain-containing protein [Actinophytocola sp.]|nr:STAS domain-containing protein [Actinophytocola sp.]
MSAEFMGGSRRPRRPAPPDARRADIQLRTGRHTEGWNPNPAAARTVGPLKLIVNFPNPDTIVIKASGDVDLCSAPGLEELTLRYLERYEPKLLVVDLAAVRFMGAAGLSFLLKLQHAANCRRVDLQIVASRIVRRPIQLLGLEKQLNLTMHAPHL